MRQNSLMFLTTTNDVPGYRIDAVLGDVMGMTVRSRDAFANFTAGWRAVGGGELPEMTQMAYEGRHQVMDRMVAECEAKGGNAVIGMRFDTSELGPQWTEVCAYGTAVVATPIPEGQPGATPQSIAVTRQEAAAR
jgi:uncharacterized protein YbjQ (UPF0145 family)